MTLIFNIGAGDAERNAIVVGLIGDEASEIARAHEKQRVVVGISEVAGIWSAIGSGVLAGHWCQQAVTHFVITDIALLPHPVRIVTQGDVATDSLEQPYGLDMLEDSVAEQILGQSEAYSHTASVRLMAAEDIQTLDSVSSLGASIRPDHGFFHRVGMAYRPQCAFTGLKQETPKGDRKEGIVVGVDGEAKPGDATVAQGVFVSRTIGFCYRNGLLAIGEDYDILRHASLCAELRVLLDLVNRKALLFLPEDKVDWPDLEAARRHRQRFGY